MDILTWHADKEREIWLTKPGKRRWKQHSSTRIEAKIKKARHFKFKVRYPKREIRILWDNS